MKWIGPNAHYLHDVPLPKNIPGYLRVCDVSSFMTNITRINKDTYEVFVQMSYMSSLLSCCGLAGVQNIYITPTCEEELIPTVAIIIKNILDRYTLPILYVLPRRGYNHYYEKPAWDALRKMGQKLHTFQNVMYPNDPGHILDLFMYVPERSKETVEVFNG